MTSYLDPYTLEESMREIRSSRKEIERLRTEVLDLKATIQIYVRELAKIHKASSAPTIPEGWQPVPEELLDAVEQFVDRVERGEVRSVMTYEKFKKALAMLAAATKHENK